MLLICTSISIFSCTFHLRKIKVSWTRKLFVGTDEEETYDWAHYIRENIQHCITRLFKSRKMFWADGVYRHFDVCTRAHVICINICITRRKRGIQRHKERRGETDRQTETYKHIFIMYNEIKTCYLNGNECHGELGHRVCPPFIY